MGGPIGLSKYVCVAFMVQISLNISFQICLCYVQTLIDSRDLDPDNLVGATAASSTNCGREGVASSTTLGTNWSISPT